ncbi:MAG TPA: aromatic amino acid lyase [Thermoanaerobaculia bacterium]|nr:aromatic amino acid lyase [Thermoanaerobaculia bacterium]
MSEAVPSAVVLDGGSLTLADLVRIARDPEVRVEIAPAALDRVRRSREQIWRIAERYREDYARLAGGEAVQPVLEYGVTTGFGEFKDIPVAPDCLEELQRNILLSHSAGVGENADPADPANRFAPEVVRAVLAIRLNAFLKGHSGVRIELAQAVHRMLDRGIVPHVPLRGSVGSSGDLCPLAHTFVVLLGEGSYDVARTAADLRALRAERREPRRGLAQLEADLGMAVPAPSYKEGLALTNGANYSAALLALAVHDAEAAANLADVAAALSLEAVCGCARAFDPKVHAARGQVGQMASAANFRTLLAGSRLLERAGAVQDVYSLRCAPAVHGAARDTVAYARMVALREINAATDNPLFFPGAETPPWDHEFRANWPATYRGEERLSYSAGNFHGEPVGVAADLLAIGLAELANIAERRIQVLLDGRQNRNLPGNLIARRGVNSGLMLTQYGAAGIVSENKVLAHPASVDSIPTSANAEDHNAMSTYAGRKLQTVLRNAQAVLAIELLVGAQAVEWRVGMGIDPGLKAPRLTEWAEAEREAEAFAAATARERRGEIATHLGRGTGAAYLAVREVAEPLLADRTLDGDIRGVQARVEDRSLLGAVERALGEPLRSVEALAPAPPASPSKP